GMSERETWPVRASKRLYEPVLRRALAHPWIATIAAVAVFASCIPVAMGLGGEFIPKLDEGDLVIDMTRLPSASLAEAASDTSRLEKSLISAFPREIRSIVSQSGRPEIG